MNWKLEVKRPTRKLKEKKSKLSLSKALSSKKLFIRKIVQDTCLLFSMRRIKKKTWFSVPTAKKQILAKFTAFCQSWKEIPVKCNLHVSYRLFPSVSFFLFDSNVIIFKVIFRTTFLVVQRWLNCCLGFVLLS